ncbi:MAG: tetratricopeptide repeat protein [Bacteroidota bacterium]
MLRHFSVLFASALVFSGCERQQGAQTDGFVSHERLQAAFSQCRAGDTFEGLAALDEIVDAAPESADARALRGLCAWTRWDQTQDDTDIERAYDDMTEAIRLLEESVDGAGSVALDRIYNHRAFIVHALDDSWERSVEDLTRAKELAPAVPMHVIDRGVARVQLGDSTGAREDLRAYLSMTDSSASRRREVAESLLAELGE